MPNLLFLGQMHISANVLNEGQVLDLPLYLFSDFKELNTDLSLVIGWEDNSHYYKGVISIFNIENEKVYVNLISYHLVQPPVLHVELILGACRPQMLKRIFEILPCFSVNKVFLLKTELSEASYLSSNLIKRGELNNLILKGIQQSGVPKSLTFEVSNSLSRLLSKKTAEETINGENIIKLVCDPKGYPIDQAVDALDADKLATNKFKDMSKVILAIGPESGWHDKELKMLSEHNYQSISISEAIFRVDSAVITTLAKIELLSDLLSRATRTNR